LAGSNVSDVRREAIDVVGLAMAREEGEGIDETGEARKPPATKKQRANTYLKRNPFVPTKIGGASAALSLSPGKHGTARTTTKNRKGGAEVVGGVFTSKACKKTKTSKQKRRGEF